MLVTITMLIVIIMIINNNDDNKSIKNNIAIKISLLAF